MHEHLRTHPYEDLEALMREALREEYELFLFSKMPAARLAPPDSPPSTPAAEMGSGAVAGAATAADEVTVDEGEAAFETDSPPALRARLPIPVTPS